MTPAGCTANSCMAFGMEDLTVSFLAVCHTPLDQAFFGGALCRRHRQFWKLGAHARNYQMSGTRLASIVVDNNQPREERTMPTIEEEKMPKPIEEEEDDDQLDEVDRERQRSEEEDEFEDEWDDDWGDEDDDLNDEDEDDAD